MINRLKQLPTNVQIRLYEIAGMAGTICSDPQGVDTPSAIRLDRGYSQEYEQAMIAYTFATPEELKDFLLSVKRNPVHLSGRVINWHGYLRRNTRGYREYLNSENWQRKRQAVFNRAMRSFVVEPVIVQSTRDKYGRLIQFTETEWKPVCEHFDCSHEAKDVHHHSYSRDSYSRVGKEKIGQYPEPSEENDLIALCKQCHAIISSLM